MVNRDVRTEWVTENYIITKKVRYPVSTASLNELSKCVVSGTGKKVCQRILTNKDLDTIELLHNFKTCSLEQISRFLNIKNYICADVAKYIAKLSKLYSITNVLKFEYSDENYDRKRIKVATVTGTGIHLIRKYTVNDCDEELESFNKIQRATIKRLRYDLNMVYKIEPVINTYLDLLEEYQEQIELFDYRMKMIDLTNELPYLPADLLVSFNDNEETKNILIRGTSNLEIEKTEFYIKLVNSFNALIENKGYLNLHLPISEHKPRLLIISKHKKMADILIETMEKEAISTEYIDILHYPNTKEYFKGLFNVNIDC